MTISKTARHARRHVRAACLIGASFAALTAAPPAFAVAFDGSPVTQDGSVTYNRSPTNGETITLNAPGAIISPPSTIILWLVNGNDFLSPGSTAQFRGPLSGDGFSVLNRLTFAGSGAIVFGGSITGQTSSTDTTIAGRVGFELVNPGSMTFSADAIVNVGEFWLRGAGVAKTVVQWFGALNTNGAGPIVPIDFNPTAGLRLENVEFIASGGSLLGNTGTLLMLDGSYFRLAGADLTLPTIFMTNTSAFGYEEGSNTASRTLTQRFVMDGAINAFVVDGGRTLTLSGTLASGGIADAIYKEGTGLLVLTGTSTNLLAHTNISQGELRVNGGIANSDVTVFTLGTLSGSGTVRSVATVSGGAISPGNGSAGIGTLTIVQNLSLNAASIFIAQVTPDGADRLTVGGASTIGGELRLIPTIGNYGFSRTFTLLSAAGGSTGFFDTITGQDFGPNYVSIVTSNASGVTLQLIAQALSAGLGPDDGSPNQRGALGMIEGAIADGDAPASFTALLPLGADALLAASDALSGEAYATSSRVALDDERLVREAALGRLRAAKDDGAAMWGQVYGGWGKGQGDGNAASYDRDATGFVAGVDMAGGGLGSDLRLGALVHYGTSTIDIGDRASSGEIKRTGVGLYGAATMGGFRLSLGGIYSALSLDMDRQVVFPGFNETLHGETDGTALQGFGEIAYRFELNDVQSLEPFVQASVVNIDLDALAETGGDAALVVDEQDNQLVSVIAGLRAGANLRLARGTVQLNGMIGYRNLSGDRSVTSFVALDASPANRDLVGAAALDRSAVVASFDASFAILDSTTMSLGYSGVFADSGDDHAAKATLSFRF